jgi:hypothetical protein
MGMKSMELDWDWDLGWASRAFALLLAQCIDRPGISLDPT